MTNEFGVELDRNGYAPSIMVHSEGCDICRRTDRPLQRHEAFGGAFRERSKALGCWMWVCDACHTKMHQKDAQLRFRVKQLVQLQAMQTYEWTVDQFRAYFGRNYLDEL